MGNEGNYDDSPAAFNMALDTLQRLGEILREIKMVSTNPGFSEELKQEMKIKLVKQFFIQATPLLDKKCVDEHKETILNLRPLIVDVLDRSGLTTRTVGKSIACSEEIELTLDRIMIDLQISLQKQKYFMPASDFGDMF